ncbi:3-oxoacyl-ACP synthase [Subsaxibacter sp. CAU 1640]|uniref:3-oxoacyl-ACP synthase n=1 Tax=Subsaxibacter sp. CAU 1640 TaxID=2933271 RepID=UPI00293E7E71|nr:3-oxoacyl-ACP synthase [Subsaxibacter sp. CAU 1640]
MSETKSTAGDKHETGRAMLQLEREKLGKQLLEIEKLQEILSKLDSSTSSKTIGFGSIVHTTQANYFIVISAGILKVNSKMYYAISSTTPIGLLLMGKQKGDIITFKEEFTILEVL